MNHEYTIFVVNFSSENVLTTTKTKQKLLLERNQRVAQEAEARGVIQHRQMIMMMNMRKPK